MGWVSCKGRAKNSRCLGTKPTVRGVDVIDVGQARLVRARSPQVRYAPGDVRPAPEATTAFPPSHIKEVGGRASASESRSTFGHTGPLVAASVAGDAAPQRLWRRPPARPETQLQATAGSQRHFSLVKVLRCAQVSVAIRPSSCECRFVTITPIRTSDHSMKRTYFPGIIDIVVVADPAEIRTISNDSRFDRDFIGHGPVRNVQRLRKMLRIFSLNGRLFPTLLPRADPNRAAAQDELWSRLNVKADEVKHGPAELEPLAEWVRGIGTAEKLDLLVQQSIGRLFVETFTATRRVWQRPIWCLRLQALPMSRECWGGGSAADWSGPKRFLPPW
jgi:hypothetical protein